MVVLKLGGSLLALPDLAARIEAVLAQRCGAPVAMVVGGGAAAELVRAWDRVHALGDVPAHRLALAAMRLTAELVVTRLPAACIVADPESLTAAWSVGQLPLLAADAWLTQAEAVGRTTVPHTWEATSDSIAAWLATELAAEELVLLKSVDCPQGTLQQAADVDAVDPCFPVAAACISRLSWVNLRSMPCCIDHWRRVE